MTRFFRIVTFLYLVVAMSSCVSKKQIHYFQNDEINQNEVVNTYTTIFKPDDLLQITVTTDDPESSKAFNLPAVTFSSTTNLPLGQPVQQNYLVDNQGYINFPVIGKFKIGGLTRTEAIAALTGKLSPEYIKNPIINILITNYKISVIGDVLRPGTFTIPNERITLLEGIALAGDLNISGIRNDVTVTREENGKKTIYTVDLLSKKLYTSPVYYLQQNDVIYVRQSNGKIQGAASNPNAGLFISIASVIISLITLAVR